MGRPPIAKIEDMESYAAILEHKRLELVEEIIAKLDRDEGDSQNDIENLALYGNAIQSVKDAITFSAKLKS